jgi:hypothetical protein
MTAVPARFSRIASATEPSRYKGAWLEPQLNNVVTPGDVVWICQLLSQLSTRQWMDAFRAGGYSDAEATRFITRLREKIEEGLQLRARA